MFAIGSVNLKRIFVGGLTITRRLSTTPQPTNLVTLLYDLCCGLTALGLIFNLLMIFFTSFNTFSFTNNLKLRWPP